MTFAGSVTLPSATYTSLSQDLLVVKLDPQCRVLWVRQFGAFAAGVEVTAVRTGDDSSIVVGGYFEGSVDFGTGPLVSQGSYDGFLFKMDAAGTSQWARSYPGWVWDVEVDPTGVAFVGPTVGADFGAGPVSFDEAYVRLDAAGGYVYAGDMAGLGIGGTGQIPYVAGNGSGRIILTGPGLDVDSGTPVDVGQIGVAGVDGAPLWSATLTAPSGFGALLEGAAHGGLDAAGNAIVANTWSRADGYPDLASIYRYSPSGHLLSSRTLGALPPSSFLFADGSVAFDAVGNAFLGGYLQASAAFDILAPMVPIGAGDAAFVVTDPTGLPLATGHWGYAGEATEAEALALDPQERVVVAGLTSDPNGGGLQAFFAARLGW
jgi:hypothetical protein